MSPKPRPPAAALATAQLLRIEHVAEITGISIETLRRWRRDWDRDHQGPPSFRLGGRVAYKRTDVEAWIEQQYDATVTGSVTA